tara:strand:+ start:6466 stop:6735 length:270 start_codon:yes stop_codon:yes gene_type:complete
LGTEHSKIGDKMNNVKLNDSVIAHIVKLVQLGLLQGLDVVDYFRQIRLDIIESNNELILNDDYLDRHEKEINNLLQQASSENQEQQEEA